MVKVFVSYAHENVDQARKLYEQLNSIPDIEPWFDKESLLPGFKWRPAIRKTIRESRFFIALLSTQCANRGFFQKEMKEALDVLSEFPENQAFLIPIRLEECDFLSEQLKDIQYVDSFPNWDVGFKKVLTVISQTSPTPERLEVVDEAGYEYRCGIIDLDLGLTNIPQIAQKLNSIQTFFHFTAPRVSIGFDAIRSFENNPNFDLNLIPESFYEEKQYLNVDLVPCLTKYPLAVRSFKHIHFNLFSSPGPNDDRFMFISTHLLYDFTRQANCSFEKGLSHILISQLLVHFTDLRYHEETKGCVMDYCENKRDLIEGLREKRLCPDCLAKIKNENLRKAIEAILQDGIKV